MRYWLAVLLHSQRYFPPLLLFVTGVVVLTDNDTGRLTAMYGACSAVLFLSALWLTVGLIQVDDPVQRAITVVNARSSARVLTAAVLVAVSCCVLCLVFGLVFPLLSGSHQVSADAVAVGAISQLGAGMTGIAVGLLCSRPIVRRPASGGLGRVGHHPGDRGLRVDVGFPAERPATTDVQRPHPGSPARPGWCACRRGCAPAHRGHRAHPRRGYPAGLAAAWL
jgi:hypothetical protein